MVTEVKRMAQLYDSASSFNANNPVLLAGEIGIESDTGLMKIGDGSTSWNLLGYSPNTILYPRSAIELANLPSTPPVNIEFPYGHLRRWTNNLGDGTTDVSAAFQNMLDSGHKNCFIDTPSTSWRLNSTIALPAGVSVRGGRGVVLDSYVAAFNYAFTATSIGHTDGGSFIDFTLNVKNSNGYGVRINSSSGYVVDRFIINGPNDATGIGFRISSSTSSGSTFNSVAPTEGFIRNFQEGFLMSSTDPGFLKDNVVGNVHVFGNNLAGSIGLIVGRGTGACERNVINARLEDNVTGVEVTAVADENYLKVIETGSSVPWKIETGAAYNVIDTQSNFWKTGATESGSDFYDETPVQAFPARTNFITGARQFRLPYPTYVANSDIDLCNPESNSPIDIRVIEDPHAGPANSPPTVADLVISGTTNTGAGYRLLRVFNGLSEPYLQLVNSRIKLSGGTRIEWNSSDSNPTAGALVGYVTISVNGTDYKVPYYSV